MTRRFESEGARGRVRVAGSLIALGAALAFIACSASNASKAPSPGGGGLGNVGAGSTPGRGAAHGAGASPGVGANGGDTPIIIGPGAGGAGNNPPPVITNGTPFMADDTGKSGLMPDVLQKLKAGGGSCSFDIVYPYDGAMFPVGLPLQTIEWNQPSDGAYVHLKYEGSDIVDYQFAAGPTNLGQITLPQAAWDEVARRTPGAPLEVTLSSINGGNVSTCKTHWNIAPGVMSGSIYYNTYDAPGALQAGNGAIMRLTLGATQSEIYEQFTGMPNVIPGTGPCTACHSLSFNGQTLAASTHDYMAKTFEVSSYKVTAMPQPAPAAKLPNALFGALTPDGSRMLTMGNPDCTDYSDTFPRKPNNFPLLEGPDAAKLLDVATGKDLAAKGLDPKFYMWMPQFSPSGDKVVFNHAKPDGKGGTDRRELAIMDYDKATGTFSNLKVIASHLGPEPSLPYNPGGAGFGITTMGVNGCTSNGSNPPPLFGSTGALDTGSCTGPCYPAWPFFTPDGAAVIFQLSSEPDFTSAFPGRSAPAKSEIWYADLKTGKSMPLANVNKALNPADALMDYYPTVMPVAVGAKFWLFWTSRRAVGHRNYGMSAIPGVDSPDKKRIWVSAIDINPPTGADPSHPGFYLPGQSDSGNLRAFAALNPCVQNGAACKSGLDCCSGYCTVVQGQPMGTCGEMTTCSHENDKCTKDADCCPPEDGKRPLSCIGGYCGYATIK